MEISGQIALLEEAVAILKKKNDILSKNNRNWRRKCQKLRKKNRCQEQMKTENQITLLDKNCRQRGVV